MYKLVFVRHGESEWNRKNLFTGWTDVDLTPEGEIDARMMGETLNEMGFHFTLGYTSVLKRASITLEIISEELNGPHMVMVKDWRLNERSYGKLQGKSKIDIIDELDWEQVHAYRRSYKTQPPMLESDDPRHPKNDEKYDEVDRDLLPAGESLEDTYHRVVPYLLNTILPSLHSYHNILISAHGNTLRVIRKYLDNLTDNEIEGVEFGIGEILIYTLDENLQVIEREHLSAKEHPKYGGDL